MKLKVLSWNIWIDSDFNEVVKFLKNSPADIIGLQEVVNNNPARDIIKVLQNEGYNSHFGYAEHSWGGNVYTDGPAIFSKYEMSNKKTYVLSKKDKRAAVSCDIKVGNRLIHVFSTHLLHTHQKLDDEQEIQAATLIKGLPNNNVILMGDFNATPDSSVIKNVRKVLIDTDTKSLPTWSVYREGCLTCNQQTVEIKLDYIFTSKDIKTGSFTVEESKASDHLPISAIVEV